MTIAIGDPPDLGLQWCAILRTFDAATLRLFGVPASRVEELITHGQRLGSEMVPGRYVLDETTRRDVLDRLRQTDPRNEIALHTRAFQHFVGLLQRAGESGEQDDAEDACLYHLSALHDLFVEYMEWDSIISYTSALSNIRSSRRVQVWLEFYEAYMDIRMEAVTRGRDRLEQLLARTDLEPALRLRVLYACHIAYIYLSRYDRALELLNAARTIARALGDLVRRSYVLLAIGQLYNDLDNHHRALKLSKLSLRLACASRALYREMHAVYEVGNDSMQLGLWDEAIVALQEAEAKYRHLGMTRRLPMVLWAQGMIHLINGDFDRCNMVLREGLAITYAEHTNDTLATTDILSQFGLLCQAQGDDEGAITYFTQAITYAQAHDVRHWLPILRARLASLLARRGQRSQALAEWQQAVQGVEEIRSGIAMDHMRIALFGTAQYVYESLVLFLLEQDQIEDAFAYVERARSRAFLDLLTRRRPDADLSQELPQVSDAQLQMQLESVEPTTLKQLQRQLAPGEVVLEYFTTGVPARGDHWLNKIPSHNKALMAAALPAPTTLLFIIARDDVNVVRLRDIAYHPAIDAQRWSQAPDLNSNKLQPSEQTDDPILDLLRVESRITWLSQRLFAPIEQQLSGYHHIYIIPHGPLHYVPFTALRRSDGRYLLDVDGPSVSFAPSASILVHTLRRSQRRQGNDNLAIGYNGPATNQLEYAEREAAIIARLIHGEAWIGPEVKSSMLMNQPWHMRWLHIAGHAIYDGKRTRTAALHLGEGDILDADRILRTPTWRCQADIVTLSSCMSGLSYVTAGDELFGLQRAFLYAVAPTVVCTIARARDRVALLAMEQFYIRLRQGKDVRPAQALRDSLLALRAMTRAEINAALKRHGYAPLPEGGPPTDQPFNRPEYWAPFIVIGRA